MCVWVYVRVCVYGMSLMVAVRFTKRFPFELIICIMKFNRLFI